MLINTTLHQDQFLTQDLLNELVSMINKGIFLNIVYMYMFKIMCLVNFIPWILPSTGLQQRELFEVSGRRTVFFWSAMEVYFVSLPRGRAFGSTPCIYHQS